MRNRWPLVLASVPLWPIIWLVAFASLARVKLGYWPSYDHPDPDSLKGPWIILAVAELPLLLCAPLSLFVCVAGGIHAWYRRQWDWRLLLTLVTFAVFVAWLRFDPGGLFEWWID